MPSSQYAYSIVEPHPSAVPNKSYIHSGRGGAGNVMKAPSTVTRGSDASGPAARASVSSLSKPRLSFTSGRGGIGNVHDASERAIFSFDEELERQLTREKHIAPVYHVGRGGSGNLFHGRPENNAFLNQGMRRDSDSNSAKSTSSAESGADIATRKFKEGFKRMTKRNH